MMKTSKHIRKCDNLTFKPTGKEVLTNALVAIVIVTKGNKAGSLSEQWWWIQNITNECAEEVSKAEYSRERNYLF